VASASKLKVCLNPLPLVRQLQAFASVIAEFARAIQASYDDRMMDNALLLFSRWTGALGRPLTGNCAAMPKTLELQGSRLVYSRGSRMRRIDSSRLLDHFVSLADSSAGNRDLLRFALRYGPLYLCEHHGIAAYHKPVLMSSSSSPLGPAPRADVDKPFEYSWCGPKVERREPLTFSESVEAWRRLARRARSLLLVASSVRLNGAAPAELWEQADGFRGSFGKDYGRRLAYLDDPWNRLAANLDYWINAADICLRIEAEGQSLVASLGTNPFTCSIFGLVAMQLVLAVTRSEGLTSCSGCGAPFIAKRQPLAGRQVGSSVAKRNYCQYCRERGVPQRDASRDYRARKSKGHFVPLGDKPPF
jgi:hypothetical protein